MAVSNVTGNIPLWEGQGLCDPFYGDLRNGQRDCARAIQLLPRGDVPIRFGVNPARGDHRLPLDKKSGNCMVQIEAAGPELPPYIDIVPNRMVAMAEYVMNTCLQEKSSPIGGFVTSDLTNLERYITAPSTSLDQRYSRYTAFYTVTITTLVPDWLSPGNYEPEMAYLLATAALQAEQETDDPGFRNELVRRSQRFFDQARRMSPRGIRIPWWLRPPPLSSSSLNDTASLTLPGHGASNSEAATARRRRNA